MLRVYVGIFITPALLMMISMLDSGYVRTWEAAVLIEAKDEMSKLGLAS